MLLLVREFGTGLCSRGNNRNNSEVTSTTGSAIISFDRRLRGRLAGGGAAGRRKVGIRGTSALIFLAGGVREAEAESEFEYVGMFPVVHRRELAIP